MTFAIDSTEQNVMMSSTKGSFSVLEVSCLKGKSLLKYCDLDRLLNEVQCSVQVLQHPMRNASYFLTVLIILY